MQQLRHGVRDRCVAHGEERRQSLHHHLRVLPVAHLQQCLNQPNLLIRQRLDAKPVHAYYDFLFRYFCYFFPQHLLML